VSLLAYSGPRPESEALPLRRSQIGARTITYRATKAGRVKPRRTRLLAPLARDLAEFRIRCGRPGDDELVFGEWSGSDWDNWRERIFRPAAVAVGLPDDTIPRDLRGSFASLLIFEGLNVLEVAELGHKRGTCPDIYGRLLEEFDPPRRRPAVDAIREAREAVRDGAVAHWVPGCGRRKRRVRRRDCRGSRLAACSCEALCRTRTDDPFLTMRARRPDADIETPDEIGDRRRRRAPCSVAECGRVGRDPGRFRAPEPDRQVTPRAADVTFGHVVNRLADTIDAIEQRFEDERELAAGDPVGVTGSAVQIVEVERRAVDRDALLVGAQPDVGLDAGQKPTELDVLPLRP
jgi:hypothetical protein